MSSIRDTIGLSDIGAISVRDAANVLSEVASAMIRDAGGIFEVFSNASSSFSVDVDQDSFGSRLSDYSGPVITSEVVATPNGGKAPYTPLWQRTDANPEEWSIISPNALATTFRAALLAPGDEITATFTCTITDANGNVVVSGTVTATASAYSLGGLP